MSSSPINNNQVNNDASCKIVSCVVAFITISAITLLIMGILGATGAVPMAPIGARIMIGISAALIIGMISGTAKACCAK